MQAHDSLLFAFANDLVLSWIPLFLLLGMELVIHGREARVVDLHILISILFSCCWLCQAGGSDLGVCEYDCWDTIVIELPIFEVCTSFGMIDAEEPVSESATSCDGNWRELSLARHVAKSINARNIGILILVNLDMIFRSQLHAHRGWFQ